MKRLLPAISLVLLASVLSTPVLALDSTSSSVSRAEKIDQKANTAIKTLEARKNALAQRIENREVLIASRTAELKAKLEAFKDQKKAEIVQRISDNLNKINANQTGQMDKHLQKMIDILNRLETRVNDASSSGKDVATASAAIASAREAISAAQSAVSTQSKNDYTIQVSTEATIKVSVKQMRDKFFKDIQATRKLVINAKQDVAKAISSANSSMGGRL